MLEMNLIEQHYLIEPITACTSSIMSQVYNPSEGYFGAKVKKMLQLEHCRRY